MSTPRSRAAPAVVLSLVLAAGCGSRPFLGEEGAPRAVVLSTPARDSDSERVARALHDQGYEVVRKSTTIRRSRTSAAVYASREHPERVEAVARALADCGLASPEILPFQQHATGGNAVVVWLGDD